MSTRLTAPPCGPARPRGARRLAAPLLAVALLLVLSATAALGAPGTITIIEASPSLGHER